MLDNAFTIFCEGVAANNSLQALDLRNNQISHDAAAELCRALKQNCTIKALGIHVYGSITQNVKKISSWFGYRLMSQSTIFIQADFKFI